MMSLKIQTLLHMDEMPIRQPSRYPTVINEYDSDSVIADKKLSFSIHYVNSIAMILPT